MSLNNHKQYSLILLLLIILSNSSQIQTNQVSKLKDNDFKTFRQTELDKHNQFRKKHHSPNLQLDETLNTYAQKWAQNLVKLGTLKHSGGKYGQNLYYSWSSRPKDYNNGAATQSWYNEVKYYNFSNSGFSSSTGHFTQVVWKSSTKVGFGIASSSDGKDYIVASYNPPGNYMNQFTQNVLPI